MVDFAGSCWVYDNSDNSETSFQEALSYVLATEFYHSNNFTFFVDTTPVLQNQIHVLDVYQYPNEWLIDGSRPNFLTPVPTSNLNYQVSIGCAILFMFYLKHQLRFTVQQIVAKGANAATLVNVYKNLTGDSADPFPTFMALLNYKYPLAPNSSIDAYTAFPIQAIVGTQISVIKNLNQKSQLFYTKFNNTIYSTTQAIANSSANWVLNTQLQPNTAAIQIKAGADSSGQLELFYIGTDNKLYHNWQSAPNSLAWNGQQGLGGSALKIDLGYNIVTIGKYRIELFYIGTNNQLYHNWQNLTGDPWSGQNELDETTASQIQVVPTLAGLVVFYIHNTDNTIHYKVQANNWGTVNVPGINTAKQISVAQNKAGYFELFFVDVFNKPNHLIQTGATTWQQPPFVTSHQQVAEMLLVQHSDLRLEVFYTDNINHLIYHQFQTLDANGKATWPNTEYPLNGSPAKQLTPGINNNNLINLFYLNYNNGNNGGVILNNNQTPASLQPPYTASWLGETPINPPL